jgi:hypothetical protein
MVMNLIYKRQRRGMTISFSKKDYAMMLVVCDSYEP